MLEQLKEWDRELFIYLNGLGIEKYDAFWIFVTQEETWIPLYLFMIFMIFKTFSRKSAFIVFGCFILNFLLTYGFTGLVKNAVRRARPNNNELLSPLIRILQEPVHFSFFSGHTSSSVAITTYFVLILQNKYKWAYLIYIWPVLFALSRIYVGVHYPSDLFVGAIVGFIFAFITFYFTQHLLREKNEFKKKPSEPVD